jgi:hypothetical protein
VALEEMKDLGQVEVAQRVLSEIPHHFVDYMVLLNIQPEASNSKDEIEETKGI